MNLDLNSRRLTKTQVASIQKQKKIEEQSKIKVQVYRDKKLNIYPVPSFIYICPSQKTDPNIVERMTPVYKTTINRTTAVPVISRTNVIKFY
jgi:hypothetical protein